VLPQGVHLLHHGDIFFPLKGLDDLALRLVVGSPPSLSILPWRRFHIFVFVLENVAAVGEDGSQMEVATEMTQLDLALYESQPPNDADLMSLDMDSQQARAPNIARRTRSQMNLQAPQSPPAQQPTAANRK